MTQGSAGDVPAPQPSVAALIVLRDLGEADGKLVIKVALLELVATGAWRLKEVRRMLRKPLFAFGAGAAAVPQRTLLPLLSSVIERSPSMTHRGETLHGLEAVVGHLIAGRHTPRSTLELCFDDLAAAGLVAESPKTVRIGGVSRRLSVRHRTARGEALLARGVDHAVRGISDDELRYLFELGSAAAQEPEGSAFDRAYAEAAARFDAPRSHGGTDADDSPAAGWQQYGPGYRG